VEQQPPSRSTPPPPPSPPGGGVGPAPAASSGVASAPAGVDVLVCPVCKEQRAEDARYCEECGHDFESEIPPTPPLPEERTGFSGPVLWLVMVFWVVLAVVGLTFLFTALWSL
jgi:hypothetical protein